MRKIIAFLIISLIAVMPVNAEYSKKVYSQTNQVNFQVQDGYVIHSIYANDILFSSNWQIHEFYLDAFGQVYHLTIKARSEGTGGAWKHFYINLTYPNGTTVSKELKTLRLLSLNDYDIKIQYYPVEADTPFDLDVYVYMNPLDAVFESQSASFTLSDYIVFNSVVFASTSPANVEIFYSPYSEWVNTSQSYSIGDIAGIIGDIGQQVRNIIEKVPYAGELLDIFDTLYVITSGLLYYFKLIFIDNGLLTFALFEAFVLAWSAGTSRNIWSFYRKYIRVHRELFEFLLGFVRGIIGIFAEIVNALKPT